MGVALPAHAHNKKKTCNDLYARWGSELAPVNRLVLDVWAPDLVVAIADRPDLSAFIIHSTFQSGEVQLYRSQTINEIYENFSPGVRFTLNRIGRPPSEYQIVIDAKGSRMAAPLVASPKARTYLLRDLLRLPDTFSLSLPTSVGGSEAFHEFRNSTELGGWFEFLTVDKSLLKLVEPAKVPSTEEFYARYPKDSWIDLKGKDEEDRYRISDFNPKTGEVHLRHEKIESVEFEERFLAEGYPDVSFSLADVDRIKGKAFSLSDADGLEWTTGDLRGRQLHLFRWEASPAPGHRVYKGVPIKSLGKDFLQGMRGMRSTELVVGQVVDVPIASFYTRNAVNDLGSLKFQVMSNDEHGSKKVFFKRVDEAVVPWQRFALQAKAGHALASVDNFSRPAVAPEGVLSKILMMARLRSEPRLVDFAGKNAVRLLSTHYLTAEYPLWSRPVNLSEIVSLLKQSPLASATLEYDSGMRRSIDSSEIDKFRNDKAAAELKTIAKLSIKLEDKTERNFYPLFLKNVLMNWQETNPIESVQHDFAVARPNGDEHMVKVLIPKGEPQYHKVQLAEVKKLLAHLPRHLEHTFDELRLNQGKYLNSETVLGTASGLMPDEGIPKSIDVYLPYYRFSEAERLNTFWHEVGHHIASKLWQTPDPPREWEQAMSLDRRQVSNYAQTDLAEDFAVSVETYVSSDAGNLNPKLRQQFSARFALLDKIFAVDETHRIAAREISKSVKRYLVGYTILAGGGTALSLWNFYFTKPNQSKDKDKLIDEKFTDEQRDEPSGETRDNLGSAEKSAANKPESNAMLVLQQVVPAPTSSQSPDDLMPQNLGGQATSPPKSLPKKVLTKQKTVKKSPAKSRRQRHRQESDN